ncbi:hypothetical protein [Paraburkholderia phenazinium]|jgi:hypothetical protein|uniref:hypothetical protein n=1 Tax=Paraburkholderia phenazinium TaxID=60549 RepID=UPI00116003A7|nr:hypothetical protein [Paraburkholderia phenazinium]
MVSFNGVRSGYGRSYAGNNAGKHWEGGAAGKPWGCAPLPSFVLQHGANIESQFATVLAVRGALDENFSIAAESGGRQAGVKRMVRADAGTRGGARLLAGAEEGMLRIARQRAKIRVVANIQFCEHMTN